jgi:methionyl-tRNA formyltransferase
VRGPHGQTDTTPSGLPQAGEPTWYARRRAADSRLDPDRTLAQQFDLLRVVDNDRYPAFFDLRGHRYRLRIDDAGPVPEE